MDKLIIRDLEKKDLKQFIELLKELAKYENMLDEFYCNEDIIEESLLKDKLARALIFEFNNEISGYARYFFTFSSFWGKGGIYLEDIYIKENFRRKGFAKEVFKYLAKLCKDKNFKRLEWACLIENELGIKFYEKLNATNLSKKWINYRLDGKNLEDLI